MQFEYNILDLLSSNAYQLEKVTRDGNCFVFSENGKMTIEIDIYSFTMGAEAMRLTLFTDRDITASMVTDGELASVYSAFFTGDTGGGSAFFLTNGRTANKALLTLTATNGATVCGLSLEHALGHREIKETVEKEIPVVFFAEAVDKLTVSQAPVAIIQLPLEVTRENVADVTYTIVGTATSAATLTTTLYLDDAIIRPRASAVLAAGQNTVTATALLIVKPGVHMLKLLASVSTGTLTVEQGDAIMIGHGRYVKGAGLGTTPHAAVQTVIQLPNVLTVSEDVVVNVEDTIFVRVGDIIVYA